MVQQQPFRQRMCGGSSLVQVERVHFCRVHVRSRHRSVRQIIAAKEMPMANARVTAPAFVHLCVFQNKTAQVKLLQQFVQG